MNSLYTLKLPSVAICLLPMVLTHQVMAQEYNVEVGRKAVTYVQGSSYETPNRSNDFYGFPSAESESGTETVRGQENSAGAAQGFDNINTPRSRITRTKKHAQNDRCYDEEAGPNGRIYTEPGIDARESYNRESYIQDNNQNYRNGQNYPNRDNNSNRREWRNPDEVPETNYGARQSREDRFESYDSRSARSNYSGQDRMRHDRKTRNGDIAYSRNEIVNAGHHFFGNISLGLAKVVERAFQKAGPPVGYILGEEGSGAVVAGLRYGEGKLFTKFMGPQKVYWQGPSIGYDFGANGSRTLTLVYNLHDMNQLYGRYGGVTGSAYVIGGVGVTFQKKDDVTLAPIRSGIGLRLGANVGYLKYTARPTWNPF